MVLLYVGLYELDELEELEELEELALEDELEEPEELDFELDVLLGLELFWVCDKPPTVSQPAELPHLP